MMEFFNNLIQRLVGGAQQAGHAVAQDVGQATHNVVQNVQHPMNVPNNILNALPFIPHPYYFGNVAHSGTITADYTHPGTFYPQTYVNTNGDPIPYTQSRAYSRNAAMFNGAINMPYGDYTMPKYYGGSQ